MTDQLNIPHALHESVMAAASRISDIGLRRLVREQEMRRAYPDEAHDFAQDMAAAFHWCDTCGSQLNQRITYSRLVNGEMVQSESPPMRCPMCREAA